MQDSSNNPGIGDYGSSNGGRYDDYSSTLAAAGALNGGGSMIEGVGGDDSRLSPWYHNGMDMGSVSMGGGEDESSQQVWGDTATQDEEEKLVIFA